MDDFIRGLPILIITALIILMIGLLLALRIIAPENPLVLTLLMPILTYYVVDHSSKWQRIVPSQNRTSSAYNPVPARASRTAASYATALPNDATPAQPAESTPQGQ